MCSIGSRVAVVCSCPDDTPGNVISFFERNDYNIAVGISDRPLFPSLLRSRLLGSKLLTGTNLQIDQDQVSEGLLAATQLTQKTPHKHVEQQLKSLYGHRESSLGLLSLASHDRVSPDIR
jgi:hypothetical protein